MNATVRVANKRRAFTLVELLVVIGIIALLISILLPSLARARRAALQTSCLSNMRQIGQMFMLYAHDNRDRIPLGYFGPYGVTGTTTIAAQQWGSVHFPLWGRYVSANSGAPLLSSSRAFFCPDQADERFQFDGLSNKWYTTVAAAQSALAGGGTWRGGYMMRPTGPLVIDGSGNRWYAGWWDSIGASDATGGLAPALYPKSYFHLSKLGGVALVSDVIGISKWPEAVTGHPNGVNVLYGDHSVRSVDRSVWKGYVAKTSAGVANSWDTLAPTANGDVGVWADFDKQ